MKCTPECLILFYQVKAARVRLNKHTDCGQYVYIIPAFGSISVKEYMDPIDMQLGDHRYVIKIKSSLSTCSIPADTRRRNVVVPASWQCHVSAETYLTQLNEI